ncbi:hypothetical protein ABPG77_003796 [Micractinium sp. CCAP 211/92]
MSCTCGFITELTVGLVTRDGLEYAAKLALTCSDGSVVPDPVTSIVQVRNDTGPVCNSTSLVQTGALAGGCTEMTVQYDLIEGNEVDTQLGGAGREGSLTTSTAKCPTGQVLLGLAFQRYSPTLGSNPTLNGVINSMIAVCGVPKTTGVCAPKSPPPPPSPPPPSPSPPSPPPPKPPVPICKPRLALPCLPAACGLGLLPPCSACPAHACGHYTAAAPPPGAANGAFSMACGCGYVTSVSIGMVTRNGAQFASKIALGCSDGNVVPDPVSSYVGVVRNATGAVCNSTSLVQTGALAGGCSAMTIQYDRIEGNEADTQLGGAGRPGTVVTSTLRCPTGQVLLGLNPKRYSVTPGASTALVGLLNSITANCGVPKTTGVCAPKRPPSPPPRSPPPRPPPPARNPANTAVRKECTCGYVSSLEVGFITVGGKTYASRLNVKCSGGEVLKDATTTLPTTWQTTPACVGAGKLTTGPNAGACTSFTVRYDKVLNQEADVGIVNAGRTGTNTVTVRCASGVLIGIAFRRYSGGPGFATLTGILNTVVPVCGPPPTKACSSPPPPPVKTAQGWGDPHFRGFDGSRFDFHGQPGKWYDVLSSKSPSLSLSTRVERSIRAPQYTYMKEYDLTVNNTKVAVSLLPPLPSAPDIWRLAASVNGRSLSAGTTTTSTGIKVTFSDGGVGKFGTAKVEAGFITISMIQKWRPDRKELAEFLDLNILLYGRLQLPVTGILGPSYTKAAQAAVAASPVAGAAATVFSAGLDVSDT